MTLTELSPLVSLIKDIALISAAVTATTVGIFGLHTWHRQLLGTSKYELAKQLLVSVYRTRDTIVALRSSQFQPKEVPTFQLVVSDEGMSSEQFREYLVEAYKKRWANFESAYDEFQKVRAEAEVLLGKEISGLCYRLENCHYYLEQASHHYFKWIENIELHNSIPEFFRKHGCQGQVSHRPSDATRKVEPWTGSANCTHAQGPCNQPRVGNRSRIAGSTSGV